MPRNLDDRAPKIEHAEQEPLALTPVEAARALRIGRTRMFALIRTGAVDSIKIGRSRRVPRKALQEYLDRQLAGQ